MASTCSRRSLPRLRADAARPAGFTACSPRTSGSSPASRKRRRTRTALAAGTYAPVGQAVAVDGGYRLSGVGSFCSGCDNAQWQLLGGMIPQPDAAATPGFFLLRSADCVIDDNWHTMGLAGTGSKNIVARDAFVPAHRTLAFTELADAAAPGMRAPIPTRSIG